MGFNRPFLEKSLRPRKTYPKRLSHKWLHEPPLLSSEPALPCEREEGEMHGQRVENSAVHEAHRALAHGARAAASGNAADGAVAHDRSSPATFSYHRTRIHA